MMGVSSGDFLQLQYQYFINLVKYMARYLATPRHVSTPTCSLELFYPDVYTLSSLACVPARHHHYFWNGFDTKTALSNSFFTTTNPVTKSQLKEHEIISPFNPQKL
jgi:hypothetical protein